LRFRDGAGREDARREDNSEEGEARDPHRTLVL
jgi:hypothetical protein